MAAASTEPSFGDTKKTEQQQQQKSSAAAAAAPLRSKPTVKLNLYNKKKLPREMLELVASYLSPRDIVYAPKPTYYTTRVRHVIPSKKPLAAREHVEWDGEFLTGNQTKVIAGTDSRRLATAAAYRALSMRAADGTMYYPSSTTGEVMTSSVVEREGEEPHAATVMPGPKTLHHAAGPCYNQTRLAAVNSTGTLFANMTYEGRNFVLKVSPLWADAKSVDAKQVKRVKLDDSVDEFSVSTIRFAHQSDVVVIHDRADRKRQPSFGPQYVGTVYAVNPAMREPTVPMGVRSWRIPTDWFTGEYEPQLIHVDSARHLIFAHVDRGSGRIGEGAYAVYKVRTPTSATADLLAQPQHLFKLSNAAVSEARVYVNGPLGVQETPNELVVYASLWPSLKTKDDTVVVVLAKSELLF